MGVRGADGASPGFFVCAGAAGGVSPGFFVGVRAGGDATPGIFACAAGSSGAARMVRVFAALVQPFGGASGVLSAEAPRRGAGRTFLKKVVTYSP